MPKAVSSMDKLRVFVPDDVPDQIKRIAALQFAGSGDEIPVSAIPADGSYLGGTTYYEKHNIGLDTGYRRPVRPMQHRLSVRIV